MKTQNLTTTVYFLITHVPLFLFISCIQQKMVKKYFDDDLSTHTMDFASMKHGFKGIFTLVRIRKNIFLRHNFIRFLYSFFIQKLFTHL